MPWWNSDLRQVHRTRDALVAKGDAGEDTLLKKTGERRYFRKIPALFLLLKKISMPCRMASALFDPQQSGANLGEGLSCDYPVNRCQELLLWSRPWIKKQHYRTGPVFVGWSCHIMAAGSFVPGVPLRFPDYEPRTGNQEGLVLRYAIRGYIPAPVPFVLTVPLLLVSVPRYITPARIIVPTWKKRSNRFCFMIILPICW